MLELLSGALDPDYGQPFLGSLTVQSLRDLGFTVVPEPGAMDACCCRNIGVESAAVGCDQRSLSKSGLSSLRLFTTSLA